MQLEPSIEGASRRAERRTQQSALHRALRDAAKVHGLRDGVAATASALICFIPADAPGPISPVQVQRLADERGCDVRTIRNHIWQLIRAGLVTDCCRDGGGRSLVRASSGAIVSLHGISFAPLMAQAPQLAAVAAEINARATEMASLRAEISALRRRIKKLLAATDCDTPQIRACREQFARGPERLGPLDLDSLARLWGALTDMQIELQELPDSAGSSLKAVDNSDRSENSGRQSYITTESKNKSGNRSPIRAQSEKSSSERSERGDGKLTCGLEHVTLPMVLAAAPPEWAMALESCGQVSWSAVTAVAYERMSALGINQSAWALAQSSLGRSGAAVLVLIADAKHVVRGGTIRNPGAWMRRMAERAEKGEAHLHRSVFGILHAGKQLQ